jgi:hypothetical protein
MQTHVMDRLGKSNPAESEQMIPFLTLHVGFFRESRLLDLFPMSSAVGS